MGQVLRSWKEIARHMGASVRTVQRWESELQLPVRRIEARRGAMVFAFTAELDIWLRSRGATRGRLVEDSYFRTVFMDSQFPSLVVDDGPRILAANNAALDLLSASEGQLLGRRLPFLPPAEAGEGHDHWRRFLRHGACFGQTNLPQRNGGVAGVEFVIKRFPPGLHVVSILSVQEPWPKEKIWCRLVQPSFAFQVRPDTNTKTSAGSATLR